MPAVRRPALRLLPLEDRLVPAGDVLEVTPPFGGTHQINEYAPDGTLVRTLTPPQTDDARDLVVSPNGDIQLFNGTFSPELSTYSAANGTWSSQTADQWSTVNNVSYGGVAALGSYVYVSDMQTAYETAPDNGIVRFDLSNGTSQRFAAGTDYIELAMGLNGVLYALYGQTGTGDKIDKYDPVTMASLGSMTVSAGDARGLAAAADGTLYVAEWGGTVDRFDATGHYLNSVTGAGCDVDVATDGTVISGDALMAADLSNVRHLGFGTYHVAFADYQAPVLTPVLGGIESAALAYTEDDPAAAVTAGLTVADIHSSTLAGATVAITANFAPGEDVLDFPGAAGITGSYDPATGVLTLSGAASPAAYQAALRTVTYRNTSENPSGLTRTLTFQVDDGRAADNLSNSVSRDVTVTPVNDAPVVTPPAAAPVGTENNVLPLDGYSVADPDAGSGTETLTVSVSHGVVNLGDLSGLTLVGGSNGSRTLSVAGTVPALDNALRPGMFAYIPDLGFLGTDTLAVSLDDGGNSGTGGAKAGEGDETLTVTLPPPSLTTAEIKPLTYVEGRAGSRLTGRVKVAVPLGATLTGATVAVTGNFAAGEDVLTFKDQNGITGHYDAAAGVLTLTGPATAANYQKALRTVRYRDTSHDPSLAPRTITFRVSDGEALNNTSPAMTRTVNLKAVNTAPVIGAPATGPSGPAGAPIAVDGLTLADVDSAGGVEKLTLHATHGTVRLADVTGLTIVSGANDSPTLVVEGTVAQLNAALAAGNLTFDPAAGFTGTATLSLTLNDLGHGGPGGAKSAHKAVRITVG